MAEQERPLQIEGDAVRRSLADIERQDDAIPAAAQPAVEVIFFCCYCLEVPVGNCYSMVK